MSSGLEDTGTRGLSGPICSQMFGWELLEYLLVSGHFKKENPTRQVMAHWTSLPLRYYITILIVKADERKLHCSSFLC